MTLPIRSGEGAEAARSGPRDRAPWSQDSGPAPLQYQRIALVDLLDRLLAGGVVISGEVTLSIADVDLVHISLRALIASVSSVLQHGYSEEDSP